MAVAARTNPWREALDQALLELNQAEHAFEWADPEFCDYHAFRIQAAKEKVAMILRQARQAYGLTQAGFALPDAPSMKAITPGETGGSL